MRIVRFANPMVAAQSVAAIMSSPKKKFSPRPWNQYSPEDSLWWVIPSPEWPAFRHGKYIFIKDKGVMEVGLNVEKGFGAVTQSLRSKKGVSKSIMDTDWRWHSFVDDLSSGEFDGSLELIRKRKISESPLYIRLGISFPNSRETFDPISEAPTHRLVFQWDSGRLTLREKHEPYEDFAPLSRVSSLRDLAYQMSQVRSQDWYWIDFYAFMQLALPRDGACTENLRDGHELVQIMKPWERWLGVML